MLFFLNGKFAEFDTARISVLDRGFLYGDGLFETLRVSRGRPLSWGAHYARLQAGAGVLGIPLSYSAAELEAWARELAAANHMPEAVLRIELSRGPGVRGLSPQQAGPATLVMTLHSTVPVVPGQPPRWKLATSSYRVLAKDKLTSLKHISRLRFVCARMEAEAAGADEALLLNHEGRLAEAASANLFWVEAQTLCTPPLSAGALPGIVRADLLALAPSEKFQVCERDGSLATLQLAAGVLCTNSVHGIIEVVQLDGRPTACSEVAARLHRRYWERALS